MEVTSAPQPPWCSLLLDTSSPRKRCQLASLGFISVTQRNTGEFCVNSDLHEIQFQLVIVFTGKTVGWRLKEILIPVAKVFIHRHSTLKKVCHQHTQTTVQTAETPALASDALRFRMVDSRRLTEDVQADEFSPDHS